MSPRSQDGITIWEVLVLVVVVGVLAMVAVPMVNIGKPRTNPLGVLNNARQLQLATSNLAIERKAAGESNLGWPGEHHGSFSNWISSLTGILSTNDICKMLSAPGMRVTPETMYSMDQTALRVYAVTKNSDSNTVMISSANFTNSPSGGEPLHAKSKPFGKRGFIVMRVGGDGSAFQSRFIGNTNLIGSYAPLCK